MGALHEELAGETKKGACKLCTFLFSLPPASRAEWERELAQPIEEVGNSAVVVAMKRRGVGIEEASVRRHRRNHVAN